MNLYEYLDRRIRDFEANINIGTLEEKAKAEYAKTLFEAIKEFHPPPHPKPAPDRDGWWWNEFIDEPVYAWSLNGEWIYTDIFGDTTPVKRAPGRWIYIGQKPTFPRDLEKTVKDPRTGVEVRVKTP